jgi:transposase-like protein
MDSHKNARLTPKGREDMVRAVVDEGVSQAAAARCFNTLAKTVAKWVQRFRKKARRDGAIARRFEVFKQKERDQIWIFQMGPFRKLSFNNQKNSRNTC